MSASWNIGVDQGATLGITFTWLQSDQQTPVDLTGFSAHAQVRTDAGGALLADFSTTGGSITLGGTAGTISLAAGASETAGWTWDGGYYDLQLTDGFGDVTTLLAGLFTVTPAVTT